MAYLSSQRSCAAELEVDIEPATKRVQYKDKWSWPSFWTQLNCPVLYFAAQQTRNQRVLLCKTCRHMLFLWTSWQLRDVITDMQGVNTQRRLSRTNSSVHFELRSDEGLSSKRQLHVIFTVAIWSLPCLIPNFRLLNFFQLKMKQTLFIVRIRGKNTSGHLDVIVAFFRKDWLPLFSTVNSSGKLVTVFFRLQYYTEKCRHMETRVVRTCRVHILNLVWLSYWYILFSSNLVGSVSHKLLFKCSDYRVTRWYK